MSRLPYLGEVLKFEGGEAIVINGIGRPKRIQLPEEIISWLKSSYPARRVLEELVTHYKFRSRLAHPGALRSMLLLLYARGKGYPPYKIARKYGVAPEQLYRLERGLKKDNLYEFVINILTAQS